MVKMRAKQEQEGLVWRRAEVAGGIGFRRSSLGSLDLSHTADGLAQELPIGLAGRRDTWKSKGSSRAFLDPKGFRTFA